MNGSKKLVFFGTPEFAAVFLDYLVQQGFEIVGVVTAPDKPAGRGKKLQEVAVKQTAKKLGIKVLQPEKLRDETFLTSLAALHADVFVVIAFRMLPPQVWQMPALGTINLHASLLPAYRGAAPINRAIMNGETITGLTTFFIDEKIDEGKIIDSITMEIGQDETAGALHDRMTETGKTLLTRTLIAIFDNIATPKPQNTFFHENPIIMAAPKIFKDDCLINWNKSSKCIFNQIRGLSPYPGAYTCLYNDKGEKLHLKIYQSKLLANNTDHMNFSLQTDHKTFCEIILSDGIIQLTEVQQPGKKVMRIDEFLRGTPLAGIWTVDPNETP